MDRHGSLRVDLPVPTYPRPRIELSKKSLDTVCPRYSFSSIPQLPAVYDTTVFLPNTDHQERPLTARPRGRESNYVI